ncbi:MAG: hypothetical protein LH481_15270 [Burkholderiales bacterium]|nr:hypothetical protein [Burkholderiales bacterium]
MSKYEYKLLLVVNEEDMRNLESNWQSVSPDNVTFPTVRANSKLLVASLGVENTTFVTKPKPLGAHASFLQMAEPAASKADSSLQIITVPFVAGTTRKQVLEALENGSLSHLTAHCQHYSLFAVVHQ